MKVIFVEPNKEPISRNIENTLLAKQSLVEGPIDILEFTDDNVVIVLNDEGRNDSLPINRLVNNHIIYGPFLICACDNEGNFLDLSINQMDYYTKFFSLSTKNSKLC